MAIQIAQSWSANYLIIKVNTVRIGETLQNIQEICKNIEPDIPCHYGFMNDEYAKMLIAEKNLNKLVGIFSAFAMVVLCLGLLGFVMFMAEQKTKEIGVRKCLGENIASIVGRLLKPFLLTGLIASVIAFPLTWYIMERWLQNYALRIHLSIWIFISAGVITITIALLTVSWQSWRAATRNPVEALRYE
jgi:putative ABC transport system permease protein